MITDEAFEAAKEAVMAEFSVDEDYGEYNATAIWGTPEDVIREVLKAAAPYLLKNAWQSAYDQGVADERTSESNIGIAGCCCNQQTCICKINPARQNPYKTE